MRQAMRQAGSWRLRLLNQQKITTKRRFSFENRRFVDVSLIQTSNAYIVLLKMPLKEME
jgi:hypothetical protein